MIAAAASVAYRHGVVGGLEIGADPGLDYV